MNKEIKTLGCQIDKTTYDQFKRAAIISYGFHESTNIALNEAIKDYIDKTKKKHHISKKSTLF